jgi:hypothetical protein
LGGYLDHVYKGTPKGGREPSPEGERRRERERGRGECIVYSIYIGGRIDREIYLYI